MTELKSALRKRMKEILKRISTSDFDNWNTLLSNNLSKLLSDELVILEGDVIGAYAPIQFEPIWMSSISGLNIKPRLAFPAFKDKMLFKLSSYEELKMQKDFGIEILSPPYSAVNIVPKVLLIPGLSFGHLGERMGRGKGFYDRYLETFSGIKVGLCFECQLTENIPLDAHDQKMNFIVTEKNIYRIRS